MSRTGTIFTLKEKTKLNIALRFEGGLGDHILANRFVPVIKEKYPNAKMNMFSTPTGGTSFQADTITRLFNFYENTYILNKKEEDFSIRHQFGTENYPSHIANTDASNLRLLGMHDKVYNLHIDWLDWLGYDFDWQRSFYHFPLPTAEIEEFPLKEGYVVLHLASLNKGNNHRMSEKYIKEIIESLTGEFRVFVLSTAKTRAFIDSRVQESDRVSIFQKNIFEVAGLIKGCKGMLAIDSGIKYLGYTFNKPTLCWAKESIAPHQVPYAYQIRWLTFPQLCFPLEHDSGYVKKCLTNLIETNNFFLAPHIQKCDISKALIDRKLRT